MTDRNVLRPVGFRHALQPRETAPGFVSRVAALNGRPMRNLLRDMEIAPRALDKAVEQAIRAVAYIGSADPEALLRWSPAPARNARFHQVSGELFGRLSINRTFFRFCPRCVQDDLRTFEGPIQARPWLRLEWTISHFRSCGIHHVMFANTSPIRRPFEPFDFIETMAGFLPDLDALSASAVSSPPSTFQDWMSARLEGHRSPGNWLDDLPLYVGVAFSEGLGLSSLHDPKIKTMTLTEADWAEAAEEGFRIASAGEEALRSLLAKLNGRQNDTRGVWSPRDTYGYAYHLLQKTMDDPAYGKMREAVSRFALETLPLKPGTEILGTVVEAQLVHTIHSASKASGAHARTMRRLFEQNGFGGDALGAGLRDHRVTVASDAVDGMVAQLKSALTLPGVQKRTGIPLMHLRSLVAAGHLPTVTGSDKVTFAKHRFTGAAVETMMATLFDGAVEVEKASLRQMPLMKARAASNGTTEALHDMIFDGRLAWKGRLAGRADYGALLVDADEVTKLVRGTDLKDGLTKLEVMNFIPGMGRDSVTLFIATGLLRTETEFSPDARRMTTVVSRESALAFRDRYVSLGELTQRSGLHHKRVRLLLRGERIEAVFDPVEYGTFFYERARVDEVDRGDGGFWHYDKGAAQKRAVAK